MQNRVLASMQGEEGGKERLRNVLRWEEGVGERAPLRRYGANAGFRLVHVHNYRAQDGRGRE